jgi:hypothetical protein
LLLVRGVCRVVRDDGGSVLVVVMVVVVVAVPMMVKAVVVVARRVRGTWQGRVDDRRCGGAGLWLFFRRGSGRLRRSGCLRGDSRAGVALNAFAPRAAFGRSSVHQCHSVIFGRRAFLNCVVARCDLLQAALVVLVRAVVLVVHVMVVMLIAGMPFPSLLVAAGIVIVMVVAFMVVMVAAVAARRILLLASRVGVRLEQCVVGDAFVTCLHRPQLPRSVGVLRGGRDVRHHVEQEIGQQGACREGQEAAQDPARRHLRQQQQHQRRQHGRQETAERCVQHSFHPE